MLSTLHAPLILLGLLWITFGVRLYRTYRVGKLNTEFSRLSWLASFFGVLVVTFSGKDVEQSFDRLAGGLPITFYVKFISALMVIHALYFMLRPVLTLSRRADRLLRYGCLVTILIGTSTFFSCVTLPPILKEQLRYLLLALRDTVVCAYMIVAFIPATYRIWRKEAVQPMKLKHLAGLMFDMSYLLLGFGNIVTFIVSLGNLRAAAFIDITFRPALSLCIVFFIITGVPLRFLAILYWPHRLWLLRRLSRLKARIAPLVTTPVREVGEPNSLDGRIYQTVIFILDYYSVLRYQPDPTPYNMISGTITTYPDYSQLIEQLAKLP